MMVGGAPDTPACPIIGFPPWQWGVHERDASVSHTQIHIPVHTCLGIWGGLTLPAVELDTHWVQDNHTCSLHMCADVAATGAAHFSAHMPVQVCPVCPRGASLRHLRAAEKQHLFVKRTLVQHHVYMCSADAEACHSSIRRKRASAESGSRAGRGYWTEQRGVKAAAADSDLFLTAPHLRGPNLQF